jgi:CO dehydrogenase/acetyl-CoA synthase delta subunit
VIYISKDDLNDECGNDDCSIVFGIENTNTDPTKFRIKGLKGDTMLQDSKPVQGTINVPGEYEYYWFVSLEAKENDGAYWQHSIALQIDSLGGDADLYVSVMDGRDPTSEDYDFKSENAGADTIIVR